MIFRDYINLWPDKYSGKTNVSVDINENERGWET